MGMSRADYKSPLSFIVLLPPHSVRLLVKPATAVYDLHRVVHEHKNNHITHIRMDLYQQKPNKRMTFLPILYWTLMSTKPYDYQTFTSKSPVIYINL